MRNLILVGIGGTGAKIVEAVIHLAASGNTPDILYPVLIDQDNQNGNVKRCINVMNSYFNIHQNTDGDGKYFAPALEKTSNDGRDFLLLVPSQNKKFRAAIQWANMETEYAKIVNALYTKVQLDDDLEVGFKKRAHMGSLLLEQLLQKQDTNKGSELGTLIKRADSSVSVLIVGSIFGGTGSSGIVPVGRFFRNKMQNAKINAIMLTPYFVVPKDKGGDQLVKSDADMQQVKIALEMYKDEIDAIFHNILILGSHKDAVVDDKVSEITVGGADQENPSHVFELIAANFANHPSLFDGGNQKATYYTFVTDSTKEKIPPHTFRLEELFKYENGQTGNESEGKIKEERIKVMLSFAKLLLLADKEKKWAKKQPWIPNTNLNDLNILVNWAKLHNRFWEDIENEERWKRFRIENLEYDDFQLSAKLNVVDQSKSIRDTLKALNSIRKYKMIPAK